MNRTSTPMRAGYRSAPTKSHLLTYLRGPLTACPRAISRWRRVARVSPFQNGDTGIRRNVSV